MRIRRGDLQSPEREERYMEIENNKEQVPFEHYQKAFASMDSGEILGRLPEVSYDNGVFALELLGTTYEIKHPEGVVTPSAPLPVQTFLLRYLLESKATFFDGSFKTFREMPWGELYIKPYTGRVLTRAAFTFGTRVDVFRSACEKLGGLPLNHGDAGFQFDFLENYQMRIMVWAGDEEFPPNAQILYSDNFETGFAPEDRVVAGDILISVIKSRM